MGYPSISKCRIFNVKFSTSSSHRGSYHHWLLQFLDGQTSCHSEMALPPLSLTFQILARKHYLWKHHLWGIQSNFMIQCLCFHQRQALKRYLVSYRNVTEIWSLPGNHWLAQGTRKKENKCSYKNLYIFPWLLSEQYDKPCILWQTVFCFAARWNMYISICS